MEENHPALEPQDLQTPVTKGRGARSKQKYSSKPRAVSSRCTRSQVAADWTLQEMLIFVSQIAAIDADFSKSLPSPQKWKMIVDNCNALGVSKSLNQCRKKWESLLAEYIKIKDWEIQPGNVSYFSLETERKMEFGLPVIDVELFKSVDELLKAQEEQSGSEDSEPESDSENAADKLNAVIDSDSKKSKRRPGRPRKKIKGSGGEMAEEDITLELHKKAELIQAIPKEDLSENKDDALNEPKNPENILTIPTGDLNEKKDSVFNASKNPKEDLSENKDDAINEPKNPENILTIPTGDLNEKKDSAFNASKNPKEDLSKNKDDAINEPKNPENILTIPTGDLNEKKDSVFNASKNPKEDLSKNKDDAINEPKNPENILTIPTGDLNEKKDSAFDASKNPEIILPVPRGGLNENKDSALNGSKNPGSKKKKRGRGRGRPKKKVEGKEEEMVVEDEEDEMIVKLRKNIELIHAILRGDKKGKKKGNASNHSKSPAMLQTELVRRQGDQLIDVLGSLVSTLDQLSDRIQESP